MTGRPLALALVLGPSLFAGCKGEEPKSPASCDQIVELQLSASDSINPGDDGGPLPVVVRVYQLKDRAKLDQADYQAVWQDAEQTLGDAVVDKAELTLFPSGQEKRRFGRKPDAAFVAVVAIFRKPSGTDWRRVFTLPDAQAVAKGCKAEAAEKKGNRTILATSYRIKLDGSALRTLEIAGADKP